MKPASTMAFTNNRVTLQIWNWIPKLQEMFCPAKSGLFYTNGWKKNKGLG